MREVDEGGKVEVSIHTFCAVHLISFGPGRLYRPLGENVLWPGTQFSPFHVSGPHKSEAAKHRRRYLASEAGTTQPLSTRSREERLTHTTNWPSCPCAALLKTAMVAKKHARSQRDLMICAAWWCQRKGHIRT